MDKNKARKEYNKDKVQGEVTKAIKTTMIGAIASIEEKFGRLWAFNEQRPLTEEEQLFFDIFTDLRKEILDKGNSQIKKVKTIIDAYDIDYIGYTLNIALPVKRQEKEEHE